jgi:hypothetical protein
LKEGRSQGRSRKWKDVSLNHSRSNNSRGNSKEDRSPDRSLSSSNHPAKSKEGIMVAAIVEMGVAEDVEGSKS